MQHLTAQGRRLEYRLLPAIRPESGTVVLLHEALGSVAQWRDFPEKVAHATGAAVLVYSRWGHGGSEAIEGRRGLRYLHDEAERALADVLRVLGIERPLLVGHSDGASIALLHAAAGLPTRGLVAMAPHVFVEEVTLAGLRAARAAFETTDLGKRLGRYHRDAIGIFRAWNDTWLDPSFRDWNIEASLPGITCPTLLIQGADDEYGSPEQLAAIARGVSGPCEVMLLPGIGHQPQREAEADVLAAIARFAAEAG
jgi:pimeloyl-ACP methyl ester carboxylesterase